MSRVACSCLALLGLVLFSPPTLALASERRPNPVNQGKHMARRLKTGKEVPAAATATASAGGVSVSAGGAAATAGTGGVFASAGGATAAASGGNQEQQQQPLQQQQQDQTWQTTWQTGAGDDGQQGQQGGRPAPAPARPAPAAPVQPAPAPVQGGGKPVKPAPTTPAQGGGKPVRPAPAPANDPAPTPASPAAPATGGGWQSVILDKHNSYRGLQCKTPALQWDDALASQAQAWADQMAASQSLTHSGAGGVGENIAFNSGSDFVEIATWSIDQWYAEISLCATTACDGNLGATGHFTQVVWVSSTSLGCGASESGGSVYVACNYSEQGNITGQFQENVLGLC